MQTLQPRLPEQALDDLDAVELVAVQGGRDEDRGSGLAAIYHVDGHRHPRVGVEVRDRQVDDGALPRRDLIAADSERRGSGHSFKHSGICFVCDYFC